MSVCAATTLYRYCTALQVTVRSYSGFRVYTAILKVLVLLLRTSVAARGVFRYTVNCVQSIDQRRAVLSHSGRGCYGLRYDTSASLRYALRYCNQLSI